MTHLASGWEKLKDALDSHPLIQVFNTGESYAHPDDVRKLHLWPHKQDGAGAVWADVIFHNKDFTLKRVLQDYKLIFWSSDLDRDCDSEEYIKELVDNFGYGREQALAYLDYRTDGMIEYYHRKKTIGISPLWNPDLSQRDALFNSIFS